MKICTKNSNHMLRILLLTSYTSQRWLSENAIFHTHSFDLDVDRVKMAT